jgi:hypothetical protein
MHSQQTSMPCVGFEPMIPASKRVKIVHALDRSATVTGQAINEILLIPASDLPHLPEATSQLEIKLLLTLFKPYKLTRSLFRDCHCTYKYNKQVHGFQPIRPKDQETYHIHSLAYYSVAVFHVHLISDRKSVV